MKTRLHVETGGRGPDLVLLHGWGMHLGLWSAVRALLEPHFRVHYVDLPGYGNSALCRPYTLERLASRLGADLPDKVYVCGWSLGGQVALRWALAAPLQVTRLALLSTSPCFARRPGWPHGVERKVFDDFAARLKRDREDALRWFIGLQVKGEDHARRLLTELRAALFERGKPSSAALARGLDLLVDADLRAQANQVAQPALVLHGAHDRVAPVGAGRWLAKHLPRARLCILPRCAHVPQLSHPIEVAGAITSFLA